MNSPAAKHFAKVTAAKESKGATNTVDPKRSVYELMLGKLAQDKKRLKSIKSIEKKIEVKGQVAPEYDDYLDGVIESESGVEDIVLTTLMLWNADSKNYDRAVQLADYAITHSLEMPAHINRGTFDAFVEEMTDQLLTETPEELQKHRDIIEKIFDYADDADLIDQVKAKVHKLVGIFYQASDPEKTLRHYQRAVELNGNIGLKTIVKKLEKSINDNKESKDKTTANGLSPEATAAHAEREALEQKATNLGIEFEQNIESEKLEELILEAETNPETNDNDSDNEPKA